MSVNVTAKYIEFGILKNISDLQVGVLFLMHSYVQNKLL